jgi:hypothetical protein
MTALDLAPTDLAATILDELDAGRLPQAAGAPTPR